MSQKIYHEAACDCSLCIEAARGKLAKISGGGPLMFACGITTQLDIDEMQRVMNFITDFRNELLEHMPKSGLVKKFEPKETRKSQARSSMQEITLSKRADDVRDRLGSAYSHDAVKAILCVDYRNRRNLGFPRELMPSPETMQRIISKKERQ